MMAPAKAKIKHFTPQAMVDVFLCLLDAKLINEFHI
jgi:hypothetical protein